MRKYVVFVGSAFASGFLFYWVAVIAYSFLTHDTYYTFGDTKHEIIIASVITFVTSWGITDQLRQHVLTLFLATVVSIAIQLFVFSSEQMVLLTPFPYMVVGLAGGFVFQIASRCPVKSLRQAGWGILVGLMFYIGLIAAGNMANVMKI